jgi:arylsulfatase A-like enzyme
MPSSRPNVLFFITDQHRADHTGFGGHPLAQTPHLDALAARAMQFDRAIVANPICMPNRSTILTGRQPSVHGTRFNGVALDPSNETFVRALAQAGWQTGLVGKAHFQNMGHGEGAAANFFGEPGDAVHRSNPDGWDAWELLSRHRTERVAFPDDYYGFGHVALAVDHGDRVGGHYYQWLVEQGVRPDQLQGPEHALQRFGGWEQIYQTALPEDLYPTSYVTQQSLTWLDAAVQEDAPFFLMCSYPDPHHPFTPPGRYYDRFDPASFELPESFDDTHERSLRVFRDRRENRGKQLFPIAPFSPTEEQWRQCAAKEFGMIAMIDDGIGQILGRLEELGAARDTIVVFTSDHGDMFGDHAMMLKGGMHYEGCVRVPLLIAAPGHTPGVTDGLAGSVDLAATILELAGLPAFHGMQGTSLVPVLGDANARVRDQVLIEEDELFDLAGTGGHLRMRTLVTEEARLTYYDASEQGELFDLTRDPGERENLYAEPEGSPLRAELTERLARQMMAYAETSPKPTHFA